MRNKTLPFLLCLLLTISTGACNVALSYDSGDANLIPCDTQALIAALEAAAGQAVTELNLTPGCVYEIVRPYIYDYHLGSTGLPPIQTEVIIHGAGAILRRSPASDADPSAYRFFFIEDGGVLEVENLHLENGGWAGEMDPCAHAQTACRSGGAVLVFGGQATFRSVEFIGNGAYMGGAITIGTAEVEIEHSSFEANLAYSGGALSTGTPAIVNIAGTTFYQNQASAHPTGSTGGAIWNNGSISIVGSSFTDNLATDYGGAIVNKGVMTISESAITGNWGDGGGAVAVYGGGVTLSNTTVSGNMSTPVLYLVRMGALYVIEGGLSLEHCTVANNLGHAPAITSLGDTYVGLENTIVANNDGGDCHFIRTTVETNAVLDTDGSCQATLPSTDPMLGPLANNGGGTLTHALHPSSPAVDIAIGDCPASDQRGVVRPYGDGCDLGAYEYRLAEMGDVPQVVPDDAVPSEPARPEIDVARVEMESPCLEAPAADSRTITTLRVGGVVEVLGLSSGGYFIMVRDPCEPEIPCYVDPSALTLEDELDRLRLIPDPTPTPTPTPRPPPPPAPTATPCVGAGCGN
ncbi:MAG: choice-of-anchor Q domain-containing protein [Anaerolineales bacterium]|jgi:hypothetical protein